MPGSETVTRHGSITIRDVARAANVSISTVSHVLSGKRPTSSQTRRRVEAVIERMVRVGQQAAVAIGVGVSTPEELQRRRAQGCTFLGYSSDYGLLSAASRTALAAFRGS